MPLRISPSLASAPLEHLSKVVIELESAGADMIHFDIEDGSFVPVMTLGTKVIRDARPFTRLPFDVHLMMVNPEWILPEVISAGANRVSVHYEACPYPRRILRQIVSLGAQAGIAFNPATPIPDLRYLLPYLSFVLVLTTEPEIPDALFLPEITERLREGRQGAGLEKVEWVVDGGIHPGNLAQVMQAGADTIVAGRSVFQDGRIRENLAALRAAAA